MHSLPPISSHLPFQTHCLSVILPVFLQQVLQQLLITAALRTLLLLSEYWYQADACVYRTERILQQMHAETVRHAFRYSHGLQIPTLLYLHSARPALRLDVILLSSLAAENQ